MGKLTKVLLKFEPSPFQFFVLMSLNTLVLAGVLKFIYDAYLTMPVESVKHIILIFFWIAVCITILCGIILKNLLNHKYYD